MANGLINKELIMKAWTHLRKTEMTIPDETLDFMRDVSLEKCAEMEVCDWGIANTGERQLTIPVVSQRSELLKVLEYTRQIKGNPKEIQLLVDKMYLENL